MTIIEKLKKLGFTDIDVDAGDNSEGDIIVHCGRDGFRYFTGLSPDNLLRRDEITIEVTCSEIYDDPDFALHNPDIPESVLIGKLVFQAESDS